MKKPKARKTDLKRSAKFAREMKALRIEVGTECIKNIVAMLSQNAELTDIMTCLEDIVTGVVASTITPDNYRDAHGYIFSNTANRLIDFQNKFASGELSWLEVTLDEKETAARLRKLS